MHKKHHHWLNVKKRQYLWSEYPFKLSPPKENGAELFFTIVHQLGVSFFTLAQNKKRPTQDISLVYLVLKCSSSPLISFTSICIFLEIFIETF